MAWGPAGRCYTRSAMRTFSEPALNQWSPAAPPVTGRADLVKLINGNAARLGSAPLDSAAEKQTLLATGHQAWLWHPGILAKDIAMQAAAQRLRAQGVHLVVDQDAHEALQLDLPVQKDDALSARTLRLAPTLPTVPTGAQPPADVDRILDTLRSAGDDRVQPLIDAFTNLPPCRTLAEQMAVVLVRLMQPYTGPLPLLFVSDLAKMPTYPALIEAMLHDARRCAQLYNAAVAAHPQAGVSQLVIERDRVELPLWLVHWGEARQRIYADLADATPVLTDASGSAVDAQSDTLLPRALLLTAIMRGQCCDLFIHGKGGGVYDQITDQWWQSWRGETLAPNAVVSADMHLDFDVPVSTPDDVTRAVWFRHHIPHNVDRHLGLDGELAQHKRHLLAHMSDDRDKRRRYAAFQQIHAANAALAARHPDVLREAEAQFSRTMQGLANAAVAQRRDWCFALYPEAKLRRLHAAFEAEASGKAPADIQSGHASSRP